MNSNAEIKKIKIAVIGTVGIPAKYGGWETLVENMTLLLSNKIDFTVYCSSKKYKDKIDNYNGAKLKYIDLNPNGPQSIIYDFVSMLDAYKKNDILLVLGVSGCIFLPLIKITNSSLFLDLHFVNPSCSHFTKSSDLDNLVRSISSILQIILSVLLILFNSIFLLLNNKLITYLLND